MAAGVAQAQQAEQRSVREMNQIRVERFELPGHAVGQSLRLFLIRKAHRGIRLQADHFFAHCQLGERRAGETTKTDPGMLEVRKHPGKGMSRRGG
ncbi:hypothetical protein [Thauera sp.]|uniref:hypothetical protein n=1 Tax=Thauera sp. TaxID=1905334 RepID=UPI0026312431|nr:hypothetical protein [Thauera sp.]